MKTTNEKAESFKARWVAASMTFLIAALLTNLCGGKTGMAQNMNWTEITIQESERPPARSWPGMCFDTNRGVIVLHGGRMTDSSDGSTKSGNDTWEFNGASWKPVSTDGPSRAGMQMAFDETRGVCVLFGGYEIGSGWIAKGDTWEWDGLEWKQANKTSNQPGQMHGLVYDPHRQKVIRHGGGTLEDPAQYSTTYEWDGEKWTYITNDGPAGYAGLYFDTRLQKVTALTALYIPDSGYEGHLHELNGDHWIENTDYYPDQEPPWGRSYAFDPIRNVLTTFGGQGKASLGYSMSFWEYRTMEWDGKVNYEMITKNSPSERAGASMIYDPKGNRMVLFGGEDETGSMLNDSWQYKSTASGIQNEIWALY